MRKTILAAYYFLVIAKVSAQGDVENRINIPNPFGHGINSLFDLLQTVVNNIILPIGGVLAVLAFIYSGFLYVTAQGNETKLKTAHTALLYTAIGTAVLLGSWTLANVIKATINQLMT
ncbi:MAG: hypothetical protein UY54_C0022G0005 [Parcubacteria group bacterium GW2011_GWA2_50_10b]|nr:MAG: hypothetical protein UY54_C0022G0005 [Parcubacteria group bacterium GW2011_GWA2_50_10b]